MKKQLTIIIGLLLSSSITVHAQVAQKLRELGMENIRTIETGGTTVAAFEDNVYRGTYRGVGKAIIEWKEWATATWNWWHWTETVFRNSASACRIR